MVLCDLWVTTPLDIPVINPLKELPMLRQRPCPDSSIIRILSSSTLLLTVPLAQAQTITAAPFSPASIPVDHPGALLLLALAIAACVPWMLRKGLLSPHRVRAVGAGLAALALGTMVFWGDKVQAQLQELHQAFTQVSGQTLTIPVQTTGTTPGGSPQGFLPVVHTNQTAYSLRIASITAPALSTVTLLSDSTTEQTLFRGLQPQPPTDLGPCLDVICLSPILGLYSGQCE